jgi:hypothetical protein
VFLSIELVTLDSDLDYFLNLYSCMPCDASNGSLVEQNCVKVAVDQVPTKFESSIGNPRHLVLVWLNRSDRFAKPV